MPRSIALLVVGVFALAVAASPAHGDVAAVTNFQDVGATLGLDPAGLFTHKLDFPADGVSDAVAGVQFAPAAAGTGFDALTGNPYSLTMNAPTDWGPGSGDVLYDFIHNGGQEAGAVETLTLSGLSPGTYYDLRLYYRNFGPRPNDVTIDTGGAPGAEFAGVLDQATAVDTNYWQVLYQADGPTVTLTFAQQQYNNSWHQYALTNQALAQQPIVDLYNTGVVDDNVLGTGATLVPDGDADPHYTFVSGPASPSTAPQAQVQANHPAWSANGPDSKWIGVSPNGTDGDPPGTYVYETTFTIPDRVNAGTVQITGVWWADDGGANTQILLNGTNVGVSGSAPFGAADGTPFTIQHGDGGAAFVIGTNTLRFEVVNGGTGPNPHGVRVSQLIGTHDPALSALRTPIDDLFNTGVTDDDDFGAGATLVADGDADPHYRFVSGAQSPSTAPQAQVQSNHPAWSVNGPDSKWIGVSPAGTDNDQPGPYQYETTFTIPAGVDAATVQIGGYWFADDSNVDTQIFLNGTNVGVSGSAPFGAALPGTPFTIDYGDGGAAFVTGTNTLMFQVVNGGTNPHGLRVNQLAGSFLTPGDRVPILDLYNTGVTTDDQFGVNATLAADGSADAHYQFISGPQAPGTAPQATVQLNHPSWAANGPDAKWIGVTPVGADNVAEGDYVFETTFTIPAGLDVSTAQITGFAWADNSVHILLNGSDVGFSGTAPFSAAYPGTSFTINYGSGNRAVFKTGENILRFELANAGDTPNPAGLRIERIAGTLEPTDPTRVPIADLFNTGVASDDPFGVNAVLLADGEPDPHYAFAFGPQAPPTAPQAQVQSNHPAWNANGPDSKWIGISPAGTDNNAGGVYAYETTFTIPDGYNPMTAEISGYWWVDDSNDTQTRILLNGVDTGVDGTAPFGAGWPGTAFAISGETGAHFISGLNTLTFEVLNGGDNPHGLRVTRLRGSVAVPEPGTLAVMALGALLVAAATRKRRNKLPS